MPSVEVMLWCALVLCVSYRRVTTQPTTDECSSDDVNNRQFVLMEQMISMLQAINERQISLMEQIHCTLLSNNVQEQQAGNVGY